jgi:hypothetical protein
MADDDLRKLERLAAAGDPDAAERLLRARARVGESTGTSPIGWEACTAVENALHEASDQLGRTVAAVVELQRLNRERGRATGPQHVTHAAQLLKLAQKLSSLVEARPTSPPHGSKRRARRPRG